jgi:DNA-binding protein HU-alpha
MTDMADGEAQESSAESAVDTTVASVELRLKDLLDHVTKASGFKKKDVKVVVEATVAQIGAALRKGEAWTLPGLGRLRVVRVAAEAGGAMTLKLRLPTPGAKAGADAKPEADGQDAD